MGTDAGSRDRTAASKGARDRATWLAAAVALVVVLTLIGVGISRLGSLERSEADGRSVAISASAPADETTADSVDTPKDGAAAPPAVVEVATRATTSLPAGITSIRQADGYRAFDQAAEYQVSPDGALVAFTGLARGESGGSQVYVATIDGVNVRNLTKQGVPAASAPRWSPDGTRIVYEVTGTRGSTDMFVVNVAKGRSATKRVAHASSAEFRQVGAAPGFSSDGSTILYTKTSGDARLNLRTVPVDGGQSSLLIRNAAYGSYSPDGGTIAYQRMRPPAYPHIWPENLGIWLADADGSNQRPLDARHFDQAPIGWKHFGPAWSPDGTRVAYVSPPDGEVRMVDVGTGLGMSLGRGGRPSWLDDESLIVEGYGDPAPAFTLADLPGIWFSIQEGRPAFLFVTSFGTYSIENGGDLDSVAEEYGKLEIRGNNLRFVPRGTAGECPRETWRLVHASPLRYPGVMTGDADGVGACADYINTRLQRFHLVGKGATIDAAASPSEFEPRPVRSRDIAGIWTATPDGTFYRYYRDGSFVSYYGQAKDPYGPGFERSGGGTWRFRHGQLRVLFQGVRSCRESHGAPEPEYWGARDRLEVMDAEWIRRGVMSLTTVQDACHRAVGDEDVRVRLFPRVRPSFATEATIASGTSPSFGGATPWELSILRDKYSRRLCIDDPGDRSPDLCGPQSDPVPAWTAEIGSGLQVVDGGVGMGFGGEWHDGWGAFQEPVASIRVEIKKPGAVRWSPFDVRSVRLPAKYDASFRVFAVHCECDAVRVLGLNADGRVIRGKPM